MPIPSLSEYNPMPWAKTTYFKTKLLAHQLRNRLSCGIQPSELRSKSDVNDAPVRQFEQPHPIRRPTRRAPMPDLRGIFHQHNIVVTENWTARIDSPTLSVATAAPYSAAHNIATPMLGPNDNDPSSPTSNSIASSDTAVNDFGASAFAMRDSYQAPLKVARTPGLPMEKQGRRVGGMRSEML